MAHPVALAAKRADIMDKLRALIGVDFDNLDFGQGLGSKDPVLREVIVLETITAHVEAQQNEIARLVAKLAAKMNEEKKKSDTKSNAMSIAKV